MISTVPPAFQRLPSGLGLGALLLVATALLALPPTGHAQSTTSPDSDAPETAYLVRSAETLPVALMSARTSLTRPAASDSFTAAAADVVVVGPAVEALATGSEHADALRQSLDAGVRIVACEIAMEKVGVAADELLDGIDTAPNGFHELFRLQEDGYVTLQL